MGSSSRRGEHRKPGRPKANRATFDEIPECADKVAYELWKLTPRATGSRAAGGFCIDCLPDYQARMLGEGRCKYPQVQFKLSPDGFIDGYLPGENQR